ncbi:WD repeat SAM and U-box domain-containing protein 1 [Danaus plexippus plexippus]|uniref:WD repeat SAM and U-box domain-containing protein 1 n=1 Tax=Danaus plexippus plexippus TaxID=278856 RepID=A0A212ESZ3_DANPL|nr:WD repeat SAM and U-box domain-containing protein 1 [Danaus plexippus plexippus]
MIDPVLVTSLQVGRREVTCLDTICGRLVAGIGDGTLKLWRWNRSSGWLLLAEQKRAHRYGVTGTRFATSGVLLATVGIDGAARIWSAYEGLLEKRTLAGPDTAAARSLQWASSERLAVGHDDGGVRVWDVRGGALLAYIRPHEGAVYALATLAYNALLLTSCTDGVLKVFDFQEVTAHGNDGTAGPAPLFWEDGAHDLGAQCSTECGSDAATGGHDGRVRIWRVLGVGRQRRVEADVTLTGHTAAVTSLRWKRDLLTSASLDRTARLWSVSSTVCLRVLHAHSRYLTCIALSMDLRYIITGSNDKTIRTWSLGVFSIDDDIQPECNHIVHFGLGDLEGIGPVDEDIEDANDTVVCTSIGTHRIDRVHHAAAINCIAASQSLIATASSDGSVKIFRWFWKDEGFKLNLELELSAHTYPALAVDFGANDALLLSAGLDGCARLWDIMERKKGIEKKFKGLLFYYRVYPGLVEAALCCAWSADGALAVAGGAAGELQLLAPPRPDCLYQQSDAHDLGVLSCDFAPISHNHASESENKTYLLATGGRDALIKLWQITSEVENEHIECVSLKLARALAAYGSAVQCVRWGQFGRYENELALATGGADRWVRVWRVTETKSGLEAIATVSVPAGAAGGAPAVRLLAYERTSLLAVGSLSGTLALWQLPNTDLMEECEGAEPRFWSINGVLRWLYEYITRSNEDTDNVEVIEKRLTEAARTSQMTGARLLDDPLEELMKAFGYEDENDEENTANDENTVIRDRLIDEILWLRREPMNLELESSIPHALRCPISHEVMTEPARAADGFTYERQTFLDWCLATGPEAVRSPVTGRRLRSSVVAPNRKLRERLREHCAWKR